jgi:GxxExxY protein
VIYQRALEIELKCSRLKFEREFNMKVYYRGEEIGERRVDFYVEDKIMVEIKAISKIRECALGTRKKLFRSI